jgi:hypothetical protein
MILKYKANMANYFKLSRTDRYTAEHPEAPEYLLPGQRIGYKLANCQNTNLSLITEIWVEYKSRLEHQIETFEKQIAEWILKPTPREQTNNI